MKPEVLEHQENHMGIQNDCLENKKPSWISSYLWSLLYFKYCSSRIYRGIFLSWIY